MTSRKEKKRNMEKTLIASTWQPQMNPYIAYSSREQNFDVFQTTFCALLQVITKSSFLCLPTLHCTYTSSLWNCYLRNALILYSIFLRLERTLEGHGQSERYSNPTFRPAPFPSLSLSLFLLSFAAAAQHVKRKKERIKLLLKRLHEYFDQRQKLASLAFSASRTTTRNCHIFFFVTLQSPELRLMGRQWNTLSLNFRLTQESIYKKNKK